MCLNELCWAKSCFWACCIFLALLLMGKVTPNKYPQYTKMQCNGTLFEYFCTMWIILFECYWKKTICMQESIVINDRVITFLILILLQVIISDHCSERERLTMGGRVEDNCVWVVKKSLTESCCWLWHFLGELMKLQEISFVMFISWLPKKSML